MVVMPMPMPVIMIVMMMIMVIVPVIMVVMMMVMVMVVMRHLQAAFTGAEGRAKITIFNIAARRGHAFAFNMMMVAFLRQANLVFKAQHLRAVFAHGTIHIVVAGQNFSNAIRESGDDVIMVIEIACFDKLNLRMTSGDFIGEAINTVDQNA